MEPKRIAFAGDWHCNRDWARRAIRHASSLNADIIVHLGDFGYEFPPGFVKGVDAALRKAGLELWFVDGNHECFPTLLRYPIREDGRRQLTDRIWHLPRGFRWTWGDVSFLALGGAYSIDRKWRVPGVSWWREEEITDEQVEQAIAGGPVDVLVSHDCPTGVDIPGLAESAHLWPPLDLIRADSQRLQLRRVADAVRPSWAWHGHYHCQYETVADMGHGPVRVVGLDCDGTRLARNIRVVDLSELGDSADGEHEPIEDGSAPA